MTIALSPTLMAILNLLVSAGSAVATTQVTTATGSTALWVLAATAAVNAIGHSASSAAPGWLAALLTAAATSTAKKG
jgi:hypothetical protein